MDFRTVIKPLPGRAGTVRHGSGILLLGSCFADNIGQCLKDSLFDTCVNPFGPLYNPLSLLTAVRLLEEGNELDDSSLFFHDDSYNSFFFHSRFSHSSPSVALEQMNWSLHAAASHLRRSDVVILTPATTWTFFDNSSGMAVANCHKLPSDRFLHRCLSLDECYIALEECVDRLCHINPSVKIIFTISPLRYLGLGAHGNQISKSTLMLAVESLFSGRFGDNLDYFPAYEIMMDDLRDYRFYATDMKHPSPSAVSYIFDLFSSTYFDRETISVSAQARKLTLRLSHRLSDQESPSAVRELSGRASCANDLLHRYPFLTEAYNKYISDN